MFSTKSNIWTKHTTMYSPPLYYTFIYVQIYIFTILQKLQHFQKSLIHSIGNNEEILPKQLGCLVEPNITPNFTHRDTSTARTTTSSTLYMIRIYFVFPFCFTGHYLTRNKIFVAFKQKKSFSTLSKEIIWTAFSYIVSSAMGMYITTVFIRKI